MAQATLLQMCILESLGQLLDLFLVGARYSLCWRRSVQTCDVDGFNLLVNRREADRWGSFNFVGIEPGLDIVIGAWDQIVCQKRVSACTLAWRNERRLNSKRLLTNRGLWGLVLLVNGRHIGRTGGSAIDPR
jgi:hypothetical protein